MSYTVMNRIQVDGGSAEHFEQTFSAGMRATLPGVPGLVRSSLLRPAAPGLPYVSVMEFTTADAFRAWMSSESFAAAHSGTAREASIDASSIELFEGVVEMDF